MDAEAIMKQLHDMRYVDLEIEALRYTRMKFGRLKGLCKEAEEQTKRLLGMKKTAIAAAEVISLLDDPRYRLVLECRYIDGMSVQETADFMHYEIASVFRLTKEALRELNYILEVKNYEF